MQLRQLLAQHSKLSVAVKHALRAKPPSGECSVAISGYAEQAIIACLSLHHGLGGIQHAVGKAPFVVIPAQDLNCGPSYNARLGGVKNTG